jgi:hypothetical protein
MIVRKRDARCGFNCGISSGWREESEVSVADDADCDGFSGVPFFAYGASVGDPHQGIDDAFGIVVIRCERREDLIERVPLAVITESLVDEEEVDQVLRASTRRLVAAEPHSGFCDGIDLLGRRFLLRFGLHVVSSRTHSFVRWTEFAGGAENALSAKNNARDVLY